MTRIRTARPLPDQDLDTATPTDTAELNKALRTVQRHVVDGAAEAIELLRLALVEARKRPELIDWEYFVAEILRDVESHLALAVVSITSGTSPDVLDESEGQWNPASVTTRHKVVSVAPFIGEHGEVDYDFERSTVMVATTDDSENLAD